jgi:PAS domain S-box-containing protein
MMTAADREKKPAFENLRNDELSRQKTEGVGFKSQFAIEDSSTGLESESGGNSLRAELEQQVREGTAELKFLSETLRRQSRMLDSFFQHTINSMVVLDRDFNFIRVNRVYAEACGRLLSDFPGHNHFEYYPNPENEAIFRRVVETGKTFRAIAKPFVFPDHPERGTTYWDWSLTPLLDEGGEVEYLVFSLTDVTEIKKAQLAIQEKELLQKKLNTLLRLSLEDTGLEDFLEEALALLLSLPGLEKITGGCIFLVDGESGTLTVKAQKGTLNKQVDRCTRLPFKQCLCGRAALAGELSFAAFDDGEPHRTRGGSDPHAHYFVPIRSSGRTLGLINLHLAGDQRRCPPEKEGVLQAVADTLAGIMIRKVWEKELKDSETRLRLLSNQLLGAQEQERKRIAREIHDILGSSLSAIKYKVEDTLQRIDEIPSSQVIGNLEDLLPLIKATIGNARRIQAELRPPHLDDLGIVATLRWFCSQFQSLHPRIKVLQTYSVEEGCVPAELKLNIFRIVQEGMNNIVRHAEADRIHLVLEEKEGQVHLHIQDNGRGFDPPKYFEVSTTQRGMGISSMMERTVMSGGSFSIESIVGRGTFVKAVWPG